MPAQGVIVLVKFTSGSLGRGTGRQETLNLHALGMITALASASLRPLSSCHLCPHDYGSKIEFLRIQPFKNPANIVQNFGAVMARSNLAVVQVKIRPALGFFTTTLDQSHRSQAQQGRPLVAHDDALQVDLVKALANERAFYS